MISLRLLVERLSYHVAEAPGMSHLPPRFTCSLWACTRLWLVLQVRSPGKEIGAFFFFFFFSLALRFLDRSLVLKAVVPKISSGLDLHN